MQRINVFHLSPNFSGKGTWQKEMLHSLMMTTEKTTTIICVFFFHFEKIYVGVATDDQ
jgi:hypothetical protein